MAADAILNRSRPVNQLAPIRPVEPVLGLSQEQQDIQEETPDISLEQFRGLSYCPEHINTPLQTLDGIYIKQPGRFLPLAQEAQKIARKIKEEKASQWSSIPVGKCLNSSFNEQLNFIQTLQQIAPLYSVREHLPRD